APEEGAPEDCGVVNPDAPVSSDATAQGTDPSAGTGATTGEGDDPTQEAGEPTAEDHQDPAAVPGWVWAAAIGGVLVVVVAMLVVFRKAKAIGTGSGPSDRGGSGADQ